MNTAVVAVLATQRFVLPEVEQGQALGPAGELVLALEPGSHQTGSPGKLEARVLVQFEPGAGQVQEEALEPQMDRSLRVAIGRRRVDFEACPMAKLEELMERETAKHSHSRSLSVPVPGRRFLHKDSIVAETPPFDWQRQEIPRMDRKR